MAFEKTWTGVPPTPLTADGSPLGVIQVADTIGFKVKGEAHLADNTGLTMIVQVNQVLSSTVMVVGRIGSSPSAQAGGLKSGSIVNVSAFKVANNATIGFAQQPKNKIKTDDVDLATYECDPTVAIRTIPVDPYGELYGPDYPIPVAFDGTISIGKVEIVGPPPDSNVLEVEPDGSINVNITSEFASTPTIFNVNVPSAGTEVSQLLPTSTKSFLIKVRNGSAILQFAFSSGASGSDYISVPRGAIYESTALLVSGLTLYFQTNLPSQIIEILAWS